jgi:hypothetical protein
MRILSAAVLLTLFVPKVLGQSKPTLAVNVLSETEDSKRIAQAVSARIGSTTRYAIGGTGERLSVDIMCFTMEGIVISPATQGMDGYVCFHQVFYYPAQLAPFDSVLGTQKLISGKFAQVVEEIFDQFVSETSDERLRLARDVITQNVLSFCQDPEHKSVCGQSSRKGG